MEQTILARDKTIHNPKYKIWIDESQFQSVRRDYVRLQPHPENIQPQKTFSVTKCGKMLNSHAEALQTDMKLKRDRISLWKMA